MSSSRLNLENFSIPLEEINLATQNFSPQRCIGGGGFGYVYSGQLSNRWQNRIVAIKRLATDSHQGESEFHTEVEMISSFDHENIISFIGYCDEDNEMIIVYEYAINRSLDYHLQDRQKMRCITWTQRLNICIGAARGINYLHSGRGEHDRVIHRDVKSANILLDHNWVAKICDFGLSKSGPKNQPNTELYTQVAGTQYYLDPTYHESGILRKESDIYSFGVVMFEMLGGMLVYRIRNIGDDMSQSLINLVRRYYENEADMLIDHDIKNQIDRSSFDTFKQIAYQCLSFDPMERPAMKEVIKRLEDALDIQLQGDFAELIQFLMKDFRFCHGIRVAAFTMYKCLLYWKCFENERTTVFDQVIQIFRSATEDEDNNEQMAYWLSFTCTLLFLIEKSLERGDPTHGRMTTESSFSVSSFDFADTHAEATVKVVQQVQAKYPALLFRQLLKALVEKTYRIIRDNFKEELRPVLDLCIKAPPTFLITSDESFQEDSEFNHWQGIVDLLNILCSTIKEHFVPSTIVQMLFAQIFSYINVELFNSLLVRQESSSFRSVEYLKAGIGKLEQWCCEATEYAELVWDELKHIRQAIEFLVRNDKCDVSNDDIIYITNGLYPILSTIQLSNICTIYWDGKYDTHSVPSDVISSTIQISDDSNNNNNALKETFSLPPFVSDVSASLQLKDFATIKFDVELGNNPAFQFLYN
ncbi:unnamed protein product [Lactuca saligna]|uniref:non-specific serine/threonine protein kinase n=1 Tax=Lactuca saligna TaxID=75948 RepID=A0AA35YC60_LACSI|nr:unnamed protein product [Lactuca saligna]